MRVHMPIANLVATEVKRVVGVFGDLIGAGRAMMASLFMARRGEPPVRGTREMLEIYETSPWVRAVHGRIGTSVGDTELQLWRKDTGQRIEGPHIMLDGVGGVGGLRNPNPLMTGHDLLKITQLHVGLAGDAFWLKVRNGFGVPLQYLPIPPHWVVETPTPMQPTFRVSFGSLQELIHESAILWFHEAAPANPYRRGSGAVRAVSDEIETHEYASKHARQLFFNRALPEFVVQDPGASLAELQKHEQHFLSRLQGFWRWYKPYFTNRKLEFWQPTQQNFENLTLVPLMKHDRDVILQTTGMPPEQLGIVESSNRATAEASNFIYETRVVVPARNFIIATLTLKLAPEFDERIEVRYTSTVPEDKAHNLAVAKANPTVATMDEWRAWAGLPPVGGALGASRVVSMNVYLTDDPLDPEKRPKQSAAPAPSPGDKPPKEDDDADDDAEKAAHAQEGAA